MREIVRGRCFPWDLKDFNRRHFVAVVDDTRKEKEDIEVLILPIEDGKVGPFERPKWRNTDARNITTEEGWIAMPRADYDKIRAAISRLFEEVGSGD